MNAETIKIEPSWKKVLGEEFEKPYFKELAEFVRTEYKSGAVYPLPKYIFKAFEACPFEKVRVVILGQDPYHGVGQANGLSFAVNSGVVLPPSLKNMFKEIEAEFGIESYKTRPRDGDLTRWANQGVLLLNATLTVRASTPGSHQKKGWEFFTDAVIKKLSDEREGLVFMLWGNYAKNKGVIIDRTKHLVLESPHPSPFSALSGFFGNGHFKKTNEYLKEHGQKEIDWK
ncbi:MAG: uracil-DNA glycosylase [Patescibacteria group bacterium]